MVLTAFLVGSTGATGSELVKILASRVPEIGKLKLLQRRHKEDQPKSDKLEEHIVDFDDLQKSESVFEGCDIGFCALGTYRSRDGVKMFMKVDRDYVLNTAKIAKEKGVKQFIVVSTMGADSNSWFLYPKVKGQVENELKAMNFEKVIICQPGMIEAQRNETRIAESIAYWIIKPLSKFSNRLMISTTDIAKAMIVGALDDSIKSSVTWNNAKMLEKAKEFDIKYENF